MTVANNATVWSAELVVYGRTVIRDARPSLFICVVLCAVLQSGFRDITRRAAVFTASDGGHGLSARCKVRGVKHEVLCEVCCDWSVMCANLAVYPPTRTATIA